MTCYSSIIQVASAGLLRPMSKIPSMYSCFAVLLNLITLETTVGKDYTFRL